MPLLFLKYPSAHTQPDLQLEGLGLHWKFRSFVAQFLIQGLLAQSDATSFLGHCGGIAEMI